MKTTRLEKETNDTTSSLQDDMDPSALNRSTMHVSVMKELFENALKDIYWSEKHLTRSMPRMIEHSSSVKLKIALEAQLAETKEQVSKLEQVFKTTGHHPASKRCEAMEGLTKEADQVMDETEKGTQCDTVIIAEAQKIKHYEIAAYGTLCFYAKCLGLGDALMLLEDILEEEKRADKDLAELAVIIVNVDTLEE